MSQHNDELRRDNQELRRQIDETQRRLAGLESELRVHRSQATPNAALPNTVVPVFTGLEFGRYSGPVDTDHDGIDDEVRLYLKPTDQLGRMLVVAGRAKVQLIEVAGEEPTVLAERIWEPAEWDTAYRSGFTGDYYALTLPLPSRIETAGTRTLTVYAELTEASIGTVQRQQAGYPWQR
ncbi:MAG: hypothetical protein AAGH99_03625 [Planctomycetota bacterium]